MKPSLMQAPPLSQLFSQKLNQSAHLKKLQNLKNHRKTQLGLDKNRNSLLQSIRLHKARSFATNYNQQHSEITKKNIHFVSKLQKVKPQILKQSRSRGNLNNSVLSNKSRVSLKQKIKQQQTAKQNLRLFAKLRKVSSNINSQRILQQASKTQKIKQRLMRYSSEIGRPNRIQLKSQKYINIKPTYLSDINSRVKSTNRSLDQKPKSSAKFYSKQNIFKNKIDTSGIKRYHTSMQKVLKPVQSNNYNEQESAFLTAHPNSKYSDSNKNPRFFKVSNQIIQKKKSNIVTSNKLKTIHTDRSSKSQRNILQTKLVTTNKLIK